MNVANLYRKLKQILDNSNTALVKRGLGGISTLNEISTKINNLEINRLPYLLRKEVTEVTADDLLECSQISDYTFYRCDSLASAIIPNNIKYIGDNAFGWCNSLTDVYLYSLTPPTLHSYLAMHNATIHVPIGSGDVYKSATNWSYCSDRIVEDIEF